MKTTTETITTTTRTNRRSTKEISAWVEAVDRQAVIARELKELERLEESLRATVLAQIGNRRECTIGGQIRILTPTTIQSVKIVDPELLLEHCKANGLNYSTRTPEFVAPATARKLRLEGTIGDDLAELSEVKGIALA
jgi:hypothetical protein